MHMYNPDCRDMSKSFSQKLFCTSELAFNHRDINAYNKHTQARIYLDFVSPHGRVCDLHVYMSYATTTEVVMVERFCMDFTLPWRMAYTVQIANPLLIRIDLGIRCRLGSLIRQFAIATPMGNANAS